MQLAHVDSKRIVNLEHVALARFLPEHEATRIVCDIEFGDHPEKYIEPDKLELVLVAPSDSGYHASDGMQVIATGIDARILWRYLSSNTVSLLADS